MMEKHKPQYDLSEVKAVFSNPDNLGPMTGSSRNGARSLQMSDEDIVAVVQSLSMQDFYKSMTSLGNHKIWQDVYLPSYRKTKLYLKFTRDPNDGDYLLISFKGKDLIP